MLVCFFYNVVGNTVLFLGQTPIMGHAPWFWIWMALGVVNLWGGVGSAYLADIMPPEWRSIAFVSPGTVCHSLTTTRSSDADRCCQQVPNAEESAEESEARAGLPPTDPGVGSEAVLLATLLSG